ncbi:MAG: NADPH-dependent F420 reductase [Acidimicrobiia bacterium]|jgi:NADPH-dependent F420 reductase
MRIGVLGATGPAGRGIAARLADCGHDVVAGSRDETKAKTELEALRERWGARLDRLQPGTNLAAADFAEFIIVAVPAAAVLDTIIPIADLLEGKVVCSMVNPLVRVEREFNAALPTEGSVARQIAAVVPNAGVASSFHFVPASAFASLDAPVHGDVVTCATDSETTRAVHDVVTSIPGLRAYDGGSLENSGALEAFAAVLLTINARHKVKASLRLITEGGEDISTLA